MPYIGVWCAIIVALVAKPATSAVLSASGGMHVGCTTTQGTLLIEIFPEAAPIGVGRFVELVDEGFFGRQRGSSRGIALYRNVKGFLVQFGQTLPNRFEESPLLDDDKKGGRRLITRGTLAFAGSGPV